MPTNVKVNDLKINKLTKAQYEAAVQGGTIGEYELSVLTDDDTYATSAQLTQGLAAKQDTISDLATIRSGAAAGATAVQPSAIADMETQTHASATYATKTELADKQDIIQYSTMPTASVDNVDSIVQFTGTTDSTYTNGHFYKCVSDGQDPATYSWEEVSLGGSSYTAGTGIDITNDVISVTAPTLQNTATDSTSLTILGTPTSRVHNIIIGPEASVTDGVNSNNDIVIGYQAKCSASPGSIVVGSYAQTYNTNGEDIVIGRNAYSKSYNSVVIGARAKAEGSSEGAIKIGAQGTVYSNCIAIGMYATAGAASGGSEAISIGRAAEANNFGTVCIGSFAKCTAVGAIQIGGYGTNSEEGTLKVRFWKSNGAGGLSANYKLLDFDGTIPEARLADTTNAAQGQVLTLDANLNAVWETPSGGGASAPTLTWYTVDTAGNTLTIADTSSAQLVKVYKNGLLLQPTEDYSISGTTLTTVTAMVVGDKITVEVF